VHLKITIFIFNKLKFMTTQIPLFKVSMSPDVGKSVESVLLSGMITQGQQVEKFEQQLKEYFNFPYILTLNSATSGLTLALRLLKDELNFGEEDEVLTTPLTCTATNWPILANNMNLRWVDVDKNTCNMDLDDLKRKLSPKTKIIMFVHWGGYPIDLEKLKQVQIYCKEKFGFEPRVIEDCAHAFGAKFRGKYLGTSDNYKNIAVYSLQAIKHLTTGDGGLIFLPNKEQYEQAKLLRWFGISREQRTTSTGDFRLEPDVKDWGYKFHMNDINATIGIENLKLVTGNLQKIKDNANYYYSALSEFQKESTTIELMENSPDRESSYWIYTLKIKGNRKQEFINFMKEKGIVTSQVHNRNDIHSCVKKYKLETNKLVNLNELEKEIICIPVGWWLSENDKMHIVESIKNFNLV
jgi:dTDP-4-amino-4,6-dideoxygalactose transaminase